MAGRFVPIVDVTYDGDDTSSHMSDIPSQLPAGANVASITSALVTYSQAEGDLMRNITSLHSMPSQTGVNPWQLKVHLQFLDSKKLFNCSHNEHEKLRTISAKQLDVLCFINMDDILLPLIKTKRLQRKILSVLWQALSAAPLARRTSSFITWNGSKACSAQQHRTRKLRQWPTATHH